MADSKNTAKSKILEEIKCSAKIDRYIRLPRFFKHVVESYEDKMLKLDPVWTNMIISRRWGLSTIHLKNS